MDKIKEYLYTIYKKILTIFGDLYCAFEKPKCNAMAILETINTIQDGDIICRGYNYYLDSIFIPGEMTHSGIVLNKESMIHAVSEGVEHIHPIDFIKDTDRFIILRPNFKNEEYKKNFLKCAFKQYGKSYDFLFQNNIDSFYCHELTAYCLNHIGIKTKQENYGFKCFKKKIYTAKSIIDVCSVKYEFK